MGVRECLVVIALAASIAGGGATLRAEIIDRILAVVDGAIILQSDVAVAVRFGLVPSGTGPDVTSAALDKLIERQLILSEVDRYAPPDPPETEIDRHVSDIRSRAGTQFEAVLSLGGIDIEQLRREVRDDLRIDAYLQQRFGAIQPSEDEILQYYRAHTASFTRNGVLRPFDDAHDVARAALIAERRAGTIDEWLAGLRRRANISVLPR
jgi:peptidyl-prolyl cis-trans isomerase SurA